MEEKGRWRLPKLSRGHKRQLVVILASMGAAHILVLIGQEMTVKHIEVALAITAVGLELAA